MINKLDTNQKIKEGLTLVSEVFKEFQAPEYSVEGIANFNKFIDFNNMSELIHSEKITLYGYYINNKIIGIIGFRSPNHICLLFVDKKFHQKGIAKALFGYLLENQSNLDVITVNSSPYALNVYKKLGFKGESTIIEEDGIKYVPLSYNLV